MLTNTDTTVDRNHTVTQLQLLFAEYIVQKNVLNINKALIFFLILFNHRD